MTMPPANEPLRQLIRRLIAREGGSKDAPGQAAAAHAACERVYGELSRWVGSTGSRALFTRSLAEAGAEHPALATIGMRDRPDAGLGGVSEGIQTHGAEATAAALEALLSTLLGLLGRLIGDDMVVTLVEPKERSPRAVEGAGNGEGSAS